MSIEDELDRRIALAQGIMTRLDNGELLSSVLSQVRLLMGMAGDSTMVALMDILSYGLTNLPYQGKPFTNEAYKEAGIMYMKLCAIEDVSKLDIDETIREPWPDKIREKRDVVTGSVYEMENRTPPPDVKPWASHETANLAFQLGVLFDRTKSLLVRLRAYIYNYVSHIWIEATREKDRIDLLGPDYRLVTEKLDALETPVGSELIAAIDNLGSNNPANWSLCALGCRNVILKLGIILWKVVGQTYVARNGEKLDVSMNKEKNRLYAYIDVSSKTTTPDKQEMLDQAKALVKSIYEEGSKGKKQFRHEQAQALLVDTFHLVDLLDRATELKPVDTLTV